MKALLFLVSLLPLVFSQTEQQQQQPVISSEAAAEMGARIGRELMARLTFMSYPSTTNNNAQQSQQAPIIRTFTSADFPPSMFSNLNTQQFQGSASVPQASPQFPFPPMMPQQVLMPRGNCPYCRGNKGK